MHSSKLEADDLYVLPLSVSMDMMGRSQYDLPMERFGQTDMM